MFLASGRNNMSVEDELAWLRYTVQRRRDQTATLRTGCAA